MTNDIASVISGMSDEDRTQLAYKSVEGIQFTEPNDGTRLGYHVYLYLTGQLPSLAEAIYGARARTTVPTDELERIINQRLADAAGEAVA